MNVVYKTTWFLALSALCLGVGSRAGAQTTIFDNSHNDQSGRFPMGQYEVGNEILLAGTDRYLTLFSFEYWRTAGSSSFGAAITATLTFYLNDGPEFHGYKTPGTSFFSESFVLPTDPTDRSTLVFTPATDFLHGEPLFLPSSDMTWTVQFQGMDSGDAVGLDLYSPATVGSLYSDYWQNDGTSWALYEDAAPRSFGALMQATAQVPEPSTFALGIFGGLGVLGLARRQQRSQ